MQLTQIEIKKLVKKENPIILEIGSHIGSDTKRFLQEFRDIKLYCFEPDPRCIMAFRQFIRDDRCTLIEAAVSNIDGRTILNMSGGWPTNFPGQGDWNASSSIKQSIAHSSAHPWLTFDKNAEVETIKLDTWIETNNISSVDFIWADVQGAEKEMIEGALNTLKITKYLFTEYGETSAYPEAMNRDETIKLLGSHNFEIVPEYSDSSAAGNLLFRNKSEMEMQYYSQYQQDKYLDEIVFNKKENGFFLDIGAHDGVFLNNTVFFEKHRNWKGMCIEPIPEVFNALNKNRSCIKINGCVADKNGRSTFLRIEGYSEMLSGLVDNYDPRHLCRIDSELQQYGGKKQEIEVECFNINDVLSKNDVTHVDYCSLDVEGAEFLILKSINFETVEIDVFTIENNYGDSSLTNFMYSKGYNLIAKLGCDEVYKLRKAELGDTVKVHFTTKLVAGIVVNSSSGREPLTLIVGKGQFIKGFEAAIVGMSPGKTKRAKISSEDAFGQRRDELIFKIDRKDCPGNIELSKGMNLQLRHPDGSVTSAVIMETSADLITVDANHPLAGKDLMCELRLVEIL